MNKRDDSEKLSPARIAARKAVTQCRQREAFAHDMIERYIDSSAMSVEDRSFAARLVLGVIKTRGVLDDVLDRCLNTPQDVTDDVRDALCVSIYEILFLDKSPYAAVDQGVELVRSIAPRASGLANVVLRRVVNAKKDFPFGDPETDMAAFARLQGFPLWLAEFLVDEFGEDEARSFMVISNEAAPVFIGVNTLKANDEEIVALLEAAHGNPESVEVAGRSVYGCYRIESAQKLFDGCVRKAIDDGLIFVADAAAQRVAHAVLPDDLSSSFFEIGVGRGTKTILLQSDAWHRWGTQIHDYVVLDNRDFKISLTEERMQNYGVNVSRFIVGSAFDLDKLINKDHTFDTVFIDAPCSGLGTLRRHPEIRWRLSPQTITDNAKFNLEMLENAASYVADDGTLAYSTCTITSAENISVIKQFLVSKQGSCFEIERIDRKDAMSLPLTSGGNDAHFLAKMRRKKAIGAGKCLK